MTFGITLLSAALAFLPALTFVIVISYAFRVYCSFKALCLGTKGAMFSFEQGKKMQFMFRLLLLVIAVYNFGLTLKEVTPNWADTNGELEVRDIGTWDGAEDRVPPDPSSDPSSDPTPTPSSPSPRPGTNPTNNPPGTPTGEPAPGPTGTPEPGPTGTPEPGPTETPAPNPTEEPVRPAEPDLKMVVPCDLYAVAGAGMKPAVSSSEFAVPDIEKNQNIEISMDMPSDKTWYYSGMHIPANKDELDREMRMTKDNKLYVLRKGITLPDNIAICKERKSGYYVIVPVKPMKFKDFASIISNLDWELSE